MGSSRAASIDPVVPEFATGFGRPCSSDSRRSRRWSQARTPSGLRRFYTCSVVFRSTPLNARCRHLAIAARDVPVTDFTFAAPSILPLFRWSPGHCPLPQSDVRGGEKTGHPKLILRSSGTNDMVWREGFVIRLKSHQGQVRPRLTLRRPSAGTSHGGRGKAAGAAPPRFRPFTCVASSRAPPARRRWCRPSFRRRASGRRGRCGSSSG